MTERQIPERMQKEVQIALEEHALEQAIGKMDELSAYARSATAF